MGGEYSLAGNLSVEPAETDGRVVLSVQSPDGVVDQYEMSAADAQAVIEYRVGPDAAQPLVSEMDGYAPVSGEPSGNEATIENRGRAGGLVITVDGQEERLPKFQEQGILIEKYGFTPEQAQDAIRVMPGEPQTFNVGHEESSNFIDEKPTLEESIAALDMADISIVMTSRAGGILTIDGEEHAFTSMGPQSLGNVMEANGLDASYAGMGDRLKEGESINFSAPLNQYTPNAMDSSSKCGVSDGDTRVRCAVTGDLIAPDVGDDYLLPDLEVIDEPDVATSKCGSDYGDLRARCGFGPITWDEGNLIPAPNVPTAIEPPVSCLKDAYNEVSNQHDVVETANSLRVEAVPGTSPAAIADAQQPSAVQIAMDTNAPAFGSNMS